MNDESLSALLDGECSAAELDQLLTQMTQDPALRERFGRMALGQQICRGALVRQVPNDFAERVLAALPERPDPVVVPLPTRRVAWQPAAGLAAAAALGAVAVMVVKPDPKAVPDGAAAGATAAAPAPDEATVADLDDASARQLRNYLMAYSQSRGQQGMGGTLGYARYAAYTTDDAARGGKSDDKDGSR